MELLTVHEHTVCLDLLPLKANILDLGARGFLFTDYFHDLGHRVEAVDIEIGLSGSRGPAYWACAISDYNGRAPIVRNHDPQATRIASIKLTNTLISESSPTVECFTLKYFSEEVVKPRVYFWDLIKIDIEGSEYQVIMSLEKAPSKQLSIEFHLHTGIYGQYEMTLMEDKLKALGYIAVKHELTSEHGAGLNYWDSLFILK